MKKRYPVLAGILSIALLFGTVACGENSGTGSGWYDKDIWMTAGTDVPKTEAVLPTSANFGGDVAVHDPSVFYDDVTEKYYAFGTHFAVASSSDLITWKQEATDGNSTTLYGNEGADGKLKTLKETLGISGAIDTWAPDVMKIGNMYYMYVSATSAFGSNKSGIVRVRANNVMGPYRDEEKIVFSNGNGGEPNCIDPELFYDKDGKLWMVYGSFFAGIYIKELDEKGLPKEDGFGKLLWKGNSTGVEGPFIFYNQELDYYYLMTSDGSLSTNYNMRVARSKNPDGPYTDIAGRDMAQTAGLGNKLTGNYKFAGDRGYAALGHNSVIKKDGEYLVVHHTRWEEGSGVSGPHRVEVRQLYFNEAGWPVLSPNRYAGEKKGTVTQEKAAGAYDVVVQKTYTDVAFVSSVRYTFNADGKIVSGETEAGTWSVSQNYYVTITLGDIEYKGVIAPAWRNYGTAKGIYCMTATSAQGGALWVNAAD